MKSTVYFCSKLMKGKEVHEYAQLAMEALKIIKKNAQINEQPTNLL